MKVGVDIDGVLYPWDDCARDALVERFGIERPGPSLSWTWLKENITGEQWAWLWTAQGQDATFSRLDVYPGVVPAFNAILKAGHEVHFVTHRDPRRTAVPTAEFLSAHFRRHPWAGVHVIQNGTPKRSLARWDVFVDDKPETVLGMLVNTRAHVFCPYRPWNAELDGLDGIASPRLTRYADPRAVADWVLGSR